MEKLPGILSQIRVDFLDGADMDTVSKKYFLNDSSCILYRMRDYGLSDFEILLNMAVLHRDIDLIEMVLERSPKNFRFNLNGFLDILKSAILEQRIKLLHMLDPDRDSQFFIALFSIAHGKPKVVEYLISTGFDVTTCDNEMLRRVCNRKHDSEDISGVRIELARQLIDAKADVSVNDHEPIGRASLDKNRELVEFLLSRGGSFDKLTDQDKEYFRANPQNRGDIQVKNEIEKI